MRTCNKNYLGKKYTMSSMSAENRIGRKVGWLYRERDNRGTA